VVDIPSLPSRSPSFRPIPASSRLVMSKASRRPDKPPPLFQSESNALRPDPPKTEPRRPPRGRPVRSHPEQVYTCASPPPVPAQAVTRFDSLQALATRQKTPLHAVTGGSAPSRPLPAAGNTDDILVRYPNTEKSTKATRPRPKSLCSLNRLLNSQMTKRTEKGRGAGSKNKRRAGSRRVEGRGRRRAAARGPSMVRLRAEPRRPRREEKTRSVCFGA